MLVHIELILYLLIAPLTRYNHCLQKVYTTRNWDSWYIHSKTSFLYSKHDLLLPLLLHPSYLYIALTDRSNVAQKCDFEFGGSVWKDRVRTDFVRCRSASEKFLKDIRRLPTLPWITLINVRVPLCYAVSYNACPISFPWNAERS